MKNRKEEILITSLQLFARDGYEAVSVSQIAGALGITKGALYRHYENKRDIFLQIVKRMEERDMEQADNHAMPLENSSMEFKQQISMEQFAAYSSAMFTYWTEDRFASSFRKMLTLEQFRNEEMQTLYQQYLASGPAGYIRELFSDMGISNPQENADQFYAVMFFFYSLYDGANNKEMVKKQFQQTLDQVIERLTRLVRR